PRVVSFDLFEKTRTGHPKKVRTYRMCLKNRIREFKRSEKKHGRFLPTIGRLVKRRASPQSCWCAWIICVTLVPGNPVEIALWV
ncbi:MAG TPA: hypothetical protein PK360_13860, partial [bacterium]|nr:hypothetical protein [bacterium]